MMYVLGNNRIYCQWLSKMPLPNSYVEILMSNVMILLDEAFGIHLNLEGGALRNGIIAL